MMKPNPNSSDNLLKRFNEGDADAFGEVYSLFYDELFHFTLKLYMGTEVVASDVIHDIFIHIWQNKKQVFDDLINIKAYLYVSIRNGFRNYVTHKKCIDRYHVSSILEDDLFVTQIAESDIFSMLDQALGLLPRDCAEVLRYYFDGWQIKDIAEKLNKPERTVYNKKYEGIAILKNKLPKGKLYTFLEVVISLGIG